MSKESVAQKVLDAFRHFRVPKNGVLGEALIYQNVMIKLNPKEQDEFDAALNYLVEEGLVTGAEFKSGIPALTLTEKGYDRVYE